MSSCTVDNIMTNAKKLATRLKEHDISADQLIAHSQNLQKKIDAMKQYQEEIAELNDVAHHKPRSALVLGIQQENRHIRELQQENRELRLSLDEHQSALELIMTKYREQIVKLLETSKVDTSVLKVDFSDELNQKTQQICEMASVMAKAASLDDDAIAKEQERITQLQIENRGLRELLNISNQFQRNEKRNSGPTHPHPSIGDVQQRSADSCRESESDSADSQEGANSSGSDSLTEEEGEWELNERDEISVIENPQFAENSPSWNNDPANNSPLSAKSHDHVVDDDDDDDDEPIADRDEPAPSPSTNHNPADCDVDGETTFQENCIDLKINDS